MCRKVTQCGKFKYLRNMLKLSTRNRLHGTGFLERCIQLSDYR